MEHAKGISPPSGDKGAKQKSAFDRTSAFANYKLFAFADYSRPLLLAPRHFKMLEVAYEGTRAKWKKWLDRRNTKDRMGWEKFAAQVEAIFDLPKPRIVHAF